MGNGAPGKKRVMPKLLRHHFNSMFPLGSEDLVPSAPAVASKYRFCAPLKGWRGTGCMGLLPRGLPADLLSFSSSLVLTFLIFLVRCDLCLLLYNIIIFHLVLYGVLYIVYYIPVHILLSLLLKVSCLCKPCHAVRNTHKRLGINANYTHTHTLFHIPSHRTPSTTDVHLQVWDRSVLPDAQALVDRCPLQTQSQAL